MMTPYNNRNNPIAISKQTVEQYGLTALNNPYEGSWNPVTNTYDIEPQYLGKTNYEVIWEKMTQIAAGGSLDHAKFIFDRVLGKPMQQMEVTSMSVSYDQYLEELAKKESVDTTYEL